MPRFRSKQEIAKSLGLAVPGPSSAGGKGSKGGGSSGSRISRDQAAAAAREQAASQGALLPLLLEGGCKKAGSKLRSAAAAAAVGGKGPVLSALILLEALVGVLVSLCLAPVSLTWVGSGLLHYVRGQVAVRSSGPEGVKMLLLLLREFARR
eukprot:1159783-Pelagomonas_calceolata.AAC.10